MYLVNVHQCIICHILLYGTWSRCCILNTILPFDSTASNVCHNTRLVGLTQAYTEREKIIRNCQHDEVRVGLESKTYKRKNEIYKLKQLRFQTKLQ